MPTTKKRDRTGRLVMLDLTERSRAMLEAVRLYREHETGEIVNKSDVLRAALRRAYDDLPKSFQIPDREP